MKKIAAFLLALLLCGTCFAGCTGGGSGVEDPPDDPETPPTPPVSSDEIITDRDSIEYAFDEIYTNGEVADSENGFATSADVTGARFMLNGSYVSTLTDFSSRMDLKMELYNGESMRVVNAPAGMAFTLPVSEAPEVDYSISEYRIQYTFDDSVLTYSAENGNPYTANTDPWGIYRDEWLLRWINNDEYIANNGLERTSEVIYANTEIKPGYDLYMYSVRIVDENDIVERPYYNIAVIRETTDVVNFALFVMKSKEDKTDVMRSIVDSYSKFNARGLARNYMDAGEPLPDPNWSEETAAYFDQLQNADSVSWGAFGYSMPGVLGELNPGEQNYEYVLGRSQNMQAAIEEAWGHDFDIYPTYNGLTYEDVPTRFPLNMARVLAGGNGTNGKPVLQFTYQFTTDNNNVSTNCTPMFDILRGKYDDAFRQMAQDIKEYGYPVLFRLNNEMNTDWTSYCGLLSLLDPDIFVMTWQRLYDIFTEEGVDNCIWIWNPIATTAPYSSWGEDLCYNPGAEYFQLLGATSYEFNNGTGSTYEERAANVRSFEEHYSSLYEKNSAVWSQYSVIISEFACGSGGSATGVLGRNADIQADWVEAMFEDLNAEDKPAWVSQIKGAVWFNANDYNAQGEIMNRLRFLDPDGQRGETYDDLSATVAAFYNGFNP